VASTALLKANNLSDLTNASTARTNLGLGTAATTASTAYATAAQGTNADTAYGWGNHASAGYLTSATAATTYQPLDGDLTAIAALNGSTGLLSKTGINTWAIDTTTYASTAGSYSNPTWITALAGSKITGTIDGGTY
jgi:hypothetical protein